MIMVSRTPLAVLVLLLARLIWICVHVYTWAVYFRLHGLAGLCQTWHPHAINLPRQSFYVLRHACDFACISRSPAFQCGILRKLGIGPAWNKANNIMIMIAYSIILITIIY